MIEINKEEKEEAFEEIMNTIEDTDMSDFETVFQAGIDFVLEKIDGEEKDDDFFLRNEYDELGFLIDIDEILKRLRDENEEGYDELYGVKNLTITEVHFNDILSSPREMYLNMEIDDGDMVEYIITKIDSFGRVFVDLEDTRWESGGVKSEMEQIIMRYCAQQKYL